MSLPPLVGLRLRHIYIYMLPPPQDLPFLGLHVSDRAWIQELFLRILNLESQKIENILKCLGFKVQILR